MNELVKITKRDGVQVVDARELHRKLKTGRMYANWIKGRIEEYGFMKNEDYFITDFQHKCTDNQILCPNGHKIERGRPKVDYHITLNMAKELAMVERNAMGRKIRRYFIEMEKLAREYVIQAPRPLDVYGMEALAYDYWLLQHGYSASSGQRNARIRKHPEHFYRTAKGVWYINKVYADALLKYREGKRELSKVQGLPQVEQLEVWGAL